MRNPLTNMFKAIPVPQYFKKKEAKASTSTADQAGQIPASGTSSASSASAKPEDKRARKEKAKRERGRFSLTFGKKKKKPAPSGAFQPGGVNNPAFQQKLAQLRNQHNPDVPGPSNTNGSKTSAVSGSEHSQDNTLARAPVTSHGVTADENTAIDKPFTTLSPVAEKSETAVDGADLQHLFREEPESPVDGADLHRLFREEPEFPIDEGDLQRLFREETESPVDGADLQRLFREQPEFPIDEGDLQHLFREQPEFPIDEGDLQRLFREQPEFPIDAGDLQRLFRDSYVDDQVINPETKEVKPEELKHLSLGFQEFLDGASKVLGPAAATALKNKLGELGSLADESANLVRQLDAMLDGEGKNIAKKLEARHLGEAVRDCYARAVKICNKHIVKAENGSKRQTKLAAMSAMFTELKRHHLSATATPAFEAYSKAETKLMKQANPGMVDMHSGSIVYNAKAVALDVTFGKDKITETDPLKITGEAGVELEETEELSVDDDGDQNRWDRYSLTARLAAVFDGGIVGGKLRGRLKGSLGTNYGEAESFSDQAKLFGRQKNEDAYANMLSESAGPNARKWKDKYKGFQKVVKTASAADQTSAHAPIHLTMQKAGKGSHNTSVIHEMAKKVDSQLARLMRAAYLPLERPMAYAGASVPAGGAGQRSKEKTSITFVEGALEGSVKVVKAGITQGFINAGLTELKGALVGRRKEFNVERLKPSHVLLSGGYTKDMRKSLDLWNAIENSARSDTQTGTRLSAKLGQYNHVKDAIVGITGDHDPETPYNAAFFGPVTDIPKTFLNTILAPEDRLENLADAVAAECERLGNDYASFQKNAGVLNAVGEKRANRLVKDHYASLHKDAFDEINKSAWGREDESGSGAQQLKDVVSSSRKRSEFLADSYDALSTALGGAGTHLEILKARVAEMDNPPPELIGKINKADAGYSEANAAIMKAEIPLHEDTLHRYSTIAWTAVSTKNEVEGQLSLSAGGQPDVVSAGMALDDPKATEQGGEMTNASGAAKQEEGQQGEVLMSLDTAALGLATASLVIRNLTADHPNVTRGGDFREVHLTLGAGPGPLTGAVLEKAVIAALKKMRKDMNGVDPTSSEIAELKDAIKSVASTGALDSAKNIVLAWKYHKFSKAGDSAYRQQYFRISAQGKENFVATLNIPTATPGLNAKPGVRITQDRKNVLYEMMGKDLSHHILSNVRLGEVQAKAGAKRKLLEADIVMSDSSSAGGSRPESREASPGLETGELSQEITSEHSDSGSVTSEGNSVGKATIALATDGIKRTMHQPRKLLNTMNSMYVNEGDYQLAKKDPLNKRAEAQAQETVKVAAEAVARNQGVQLPSMFELMMKEFDDAPFRKNQFFSTNAMLDVLKDYNEFAEWKKGSPGAKQPDNGFVFYDGAEIQDIARNARKVESLAAGKASFAIETDADGNERVKPLDTRPSLSEPLTGIVDANALKAFEAKIQARLAQKKEEDSNATLTPDDRMDLFLNTDEGQDVFKSYQKIISNYKELTGLATTLVGYEGRLRDESSTFQRTERAGAALKNAGAALLSTFDGNDLRPSPGAGSAAAKVLSERGYFDEGRATDYDRLPHDNQTREQTSLWLSRHGLVKADNGSTGMHSLIVAHLQHATGRYDSLHVDEAAKYLKQLGSNTPSDKKMDKVIREINREHGAVRAHMIAPHSDNHGAPAWTGDLGATPQDADRAVVIMRSKNDQGEDTFAAVVQRKGSSAPDIPEHLQKLDNAQKIRSEVVTGSLQGQNVALTGIGFRERMRMLGAQPTNQMEGLLAVPLKNASAAFADMQRPERVDLRKMDTPTLKGEIENAAQLKAGSTRYFKEGVKELKKRDGMKDPLTGAAAEASLEQRTGKELRKEFKEKHESDLEAEASFRQMASRLKPQSQIAETMTRLTGEDVQSIAKSAVHPKIKNAAEAELRKRDKMTAGIAQKLGKGTLANLMGLQGTLRALQRSNQINRMTESEQQKIADNANNGIPNRDRKQKTKLPRN